MLFQCVALCLKELKELCNFRLTGDLGLPRWLSDKETNCLCRRQMGLDFDPLVGKIPLEEKMATLSSVLARKAPWVEQSDLLQSMGSQRVRYAWATECACECTRAHARAHTHTHTRSEKQVVSKNLKHKISYFKKGYWTLSETFTSCATPSHIYERNQWLQSHIQKQIKR